MPLLEKLALDNQSAALSLWPNPVREELNIAWRGDLKQMPRRFEIHDMSGRQIAGGDVPDGDGAAIWRSQGQPAGAYLLSVFDESGVLLVSEPFVKQ